MFLAEYDYDEDIAVKKEEAFKEGLRQKAVEAAKNLLKLDVLSHEQIAQSISLSLEDVQMIDDELKKQTPNSWRH